MQNREQMNIVIVGHVDHGKSTVIGRLLSDTCSLPEGKLEYVKEQCKRTAKPFEYAFLLDALKDEQAQGITIDIARCFFHTARRDYIVLDAPGHIEFLKNMVTGAAHAEAALLVIDAKEGIRENSKRHGYMISMVGIKQIAVLVNKMDLVEYSEEVFNAIKAEYTAFLEKINIKPVRFIPISARQGDNMVRRSENMGWYTGETVLGQVDAFAKKPTLENLPFRFPVQDIYKFTQQKDERRIIAGTVESGTIRVNDEVLFFPSMKKTVIQSIEAFNAPAKDTAAAAEAAGFTMATQIYIKPGELMCKADEPHPFVSSRFKANVFWIGAAPLVKNKTYKLKLAAARVPVKLVEILTVLDASDLTAVGNKQQIDKLDVAECVFEAGKPLAFDIIADCENTARFVIVDNYEIAGGGILLESIDTRDTLLHKHIEQRERDWDYGTILPIMRERRNGHPAHCIVITGFAGAGKRALARKLEETLFEGNVQSYYLGIANLEQGLDADIASMKEQADERVRRVGEIARIMTAAGLVFITTMDDADDFDLEMIKQLTAPGAVTVINLGESNFTRFPVDLQLERGIAPESAIKRSRALLASRGLVIEKHL